MSRAWSVVALVGATSAVADAVISASWPTPIPATDAGDDRSCVGGCRAGRVGAAPRAARRPLMAAVGVAWYWEQPWWPAPFPFTLGLLVDNVALAVALHAVLAFPTGRLRSRLDCGLVVGAYVTVLAGNLASALVVDPPRHGCADCARNLLLVHHSATLADDAAVIRQGLVRLLAEEDVEVVAQVGDADALLEVVDREAPDAVVVDIRMPPNFSDKGLRAVEALRARHPSLGVLLLSQHIDMAYAMRLVTDRSERVGYLLKDRIVDVAALVDADLLTLADLSAAVRLHFDAYGPQTIAVGVVPFDTKHEDI